MMAEQPIAEIPTNPIEMAIPVSDRVQIQNVLVVESRTKRGEDERFEAGGFGLKYHHVVEAAVADREARQIRVKILFAVVTTRENEPEPDPTLLVEATLILVYSVDSFEGIEDQNVRAFAVTNALFNAWPYWREFVQNATVRMGLPALVPPVFRFAKAPTSRPSVEREEPVKDDERESRSTAAKQP